MKYANWLDYWNKKGKTETRNQKVINGYEGKLSYLPDYSYKLLISSIKTNLNLSKKDTMLDIGCGGGILTIQIQKHVKKIVGVDASPEMLRHVPKKIETYLAKADKLPFPDQSFEKVMCHSIFQYFPNLKYAQKVLKEMARVCKKNGLIYIIDLPDKAKKEKYEQNKKSELHNLIRLFYPKIFFKKIWPKARIFDNQLKGYGNSKFRFNVLYQNK